MLTAYPIIRLIFYGKFPNLLASITFETLHSPDGGIYWKTRCPQSNAWFVFRCFPEPTHVCVTWARRCRKDPDCIEICRPLQGHDCSTVTSFPNISMCFWTYTPSFSKISNVYFVDAATAENIQTDFRTIALSKGIGEEDTRDWFARQKEEWLLLNYAEDTTFDLRNYFPHMVIFWSRLETVTPCDMLRMCGRASECPGWIATMQLLYCSKYRASRSHTTRKQWLAQSWRYGVIAI